MASIQGIKAASILSERLLDMDRISRTSSSFKREPAADRVEQILSIIKSRACGMKTILLPDADLNSQRHRRRISRMISSLANSMTYEDLNDRALLILGAKCYCHSHIASVFLHQGLPFHQNPDFRVQLQACITEYCDPPVEIDYQLMTQDGKPYGVVYVPPPISLPVYYLHRTPEGRINPTVWVRAKDDHHNNISIQRADSDAIKNLFVRYLKTILPFLDEEEWIYRERIFQSTLCKSAYDLVRVLAGFLLADDIDDREMAVRAFGEGGGLSDSTKVLIAQLLLGMIADDDLGIVYRAIEALSCVGDPRRANLLLSAVDAFPVQVQMQAISTLGEIGDELIIEQIKALQRSSRDHEVIYAIDHAIARIRQRYDLVAYDVAKMHKFQTRISTCDYSLAEKELLDSGDDICEQVMQRRWITALVRIAKCVLNTEYDDAECLADKAHKEGDTPDNRFEFWKNELEQPFSAWDKLRVSYFVLEKHFMAHHFSQFVTLTQTFCECLFRIISEDHGAKFWEGRQSYLERNWLKGRPDIANFFSAHKLKPTQRLGRPALLSLAQCLIEQQPYGEEREAQIAILAELDKVTTSLTDLRNGLIHRGQRIGISAIREHFGAAPKEILRVLRSAYGIFAIDSIGPNYFDLINADIRRCLVEAPGQVLRRDLTVVIPHSLQTSPGCSTGEVIEFIDEGGYGFIRPDVEGDRVFVHITDVIDADLLNAGQRVAYDIEIEDEGSRATRVTVVG